MAKQPKYVQLEAEAFLADFMGMTAAERGCYATIIFHLYKMHGRCIFDKYELAALCNSVSYTHLTLPTILLV